MTGEAWHTLLRARAIESCCYILPLQAGKHERRECYGHSLIVDPWGVAAEGASSPGS